MSKLDMPRSEKASLIMKRENLESLLKDYGITFENWGVGYAKSVDDLLQELNAKETKLVEEGGELVRQTEDLAVDVYCVQGTQTWKLREEKQVFEDGRERIREGEVMDSSLGEKLVEGETHEAALQRALQQELDIREEIPLTFTKGPLVKKERKSGSFPGLKSRHLLHYYTVSIPEKFYKPEGYVEVQPHKKTYFVWEKVEGLPKV